MRVLLVSHNCMSRVAGQPKAHCLAEFDDLALTVLVPDRMKAYGRWDSAEAPDAPSFRYAVGNTRWRSVLNQWYLQHYRDTISSLLREIRPDIVNVWEEPWSLTCAQTVWLTRRLCPAAKIVVETEQNIYRRLPPPFQQFQDYCLKRCDFAVARNREAADVLRTKGYAGPAAVVPNAVDCELFFPMSLETRLRLRSGYGWEPRDFVVGYVGRLVPEKGLSDAVAALPLLPPRVRLAFIGDGPVRNDLEERARALNVHDRVCFVGARPLQELPEYFNALDTLVLPSRTMPTWKEQFGRVLIEAGACGVASVGSDSGAIPEVIGPGGLIFPEGDVSSLAVCIGRLIDDGGLRERCERAALRRARELYSWRSVARRMHDIYLDVSRPRPPSATAAVAAAGGPPR